MNRIKDYIKKIGAIFVFLILVLMILFARSPKKDNTRDSSPKIATYHNLLPGQSNKDDLINSIGYPLKESSSSAEPLEYSSKSQVRNNKIYLKENTITLIKEIVTKDDDINTKIIEEEYGKHDYKLYGPDSENGYNLYIYPKSGIAYLGNEFTGDILEIWYFPVLTDIRTFIDLYAKEYSSQFKASQD